MTYRIIDASAYAGASAPADLGAVPMLQWVPIADLRVDPTYQREIGGPGSKNVWRIATAFDWIKFSPVIVAPVEGGLFAIIDGQHRVTAAAAIGIEKVPCQVVIADRKRQAEAFVSVNGATTKMTPMQMFAARVQAGEAAAIEVRDAATAVGVKILRNPKAETEMRRGETMAVGALERVASQYGAPLLTLTLRCILESTNGERPAILRAPIISAVAVCLYDHPEFRRAPGLIRAFDRFNLWVLLTKAQEQSGRGLTVTNLLYAEILERLTAALPTEVAA